MKNFNQTIIITSMSDLCRFMQKDHIKIVSMKPVKGIANEDIMKVEYCYRKKEEELRDRIVEELELTPLQKAKLEFIFSIEHARECGVPEDKILHSKEEIDAFFTAGES